MLMLSLVRLCLNGRMICFMLVWNSMNLKFSGWLLGFIMWLFLIL